MNVQGKAEKTYAHTHTHTHRIKHIFVPAFLALSGFYELHASCANVTVRSTSNQPNLQVQSIAMPPEFTDIKVDCNTSADTFCVTSLNVTGSTVVCDTTTPGEYTNLTNYNFLRSNRSLFPTFDNEFVITPTIFNSNDYFGNPVAISGDGSMVAIGNYYDTSRSTLVQERVQIYRRIGNQWIQIQQLRPPANFPTIGFSGALSFSYDGSVLAVGTAGAPFIVGNIFLAPQYVYMYTYDNALHEYTLIQAIPGSLSGGFGQALQLSATGQYLVINDDFNMNSLIFGSPASSILLLPSAWVYERSANCNSECSNQGLWEKKSLIYQQRFDTDGALLGGSAIGFRSNHIAISGDGNTIALGYPNLYTSRNPTIIQVGCVAIFKRTGSTWTQVQLITQNSRGFGQSVSLSEDGTYLAIGKIPGNVATSEVYVFAQRGTTYLQEALFPNVTGNAVSLSADGTVLAIGEQIFFGTPVNRITIALRGPDSKWTTPFSRTLAASALGASIACSADGAFIIAGAPANDGSIEGRAFIYRPVGSLVPNDTVVTGSLCVYNRTTIDSTLRVQGNIHLNGTIVTGTAGQVTACTTNLSDHRVKTNITPLSHEDIRAQLHKLQPVTFDFILRSPKGEVGQDLLRSQQAPLFEATESYEGQVGFIAQQIEKIFPHWVSTMPAMEEQAQLIDDGQVKMITIKPELYAYLVAALEYLVQKNNARNEELLCTD